MNLPTNLLESLLVPSWAIGTLLGLAAPFLDRFRNKPAGILCIIAGLTAWLPGAMIKHWSYSVLPSLANGMFMVGICGSGPIFLLALLIYLIRRKQGYKIPSVVALVGLLNGSICSWVFYHALARV